MTMWKSDAQVDALRKVKGWIEFNRECGKLNFYIEDILKDGRSFTASCFRLNVPRTSPYTMYPMAAGSGKTPLAACLDAYRKAVAIKHMPDTNLERLFDQDDDEDLIGEVPVETIEEEDLIG